MPFFSVVLITYNRADLLPRCIDSVINQTFKDWELIIVDNHSEDGSKELIEGYMARDSRIRFRQVHNNNVLAVSRNEGIRMANGEYICTLDSDDWYTENKLQTVYDVCCKTPYDVIYSKFQLMSAKGAGDVHGASLTWDDTFMELLVNGNSICNMTTVIKKKAWEDVGLLSEDPQLSAVEDIDGLLNLSYTKHSFHFIDEVLGYYWVGDNMSHSPKQIERAKTLFEKWIVKVEDEKKREMARGGRYFLYGRLYHGLGDWKNARANYKMVLLNKYSLKKKEAVVLYVMALLKIKR